MTIVLLLAAMTLVAAIVQSVAFKRLVTYVEGQLTRPLSPYAPRATVILPCKGLDPGFHDNIRKLLAQDYPNFDVIFCLASDSDPAYAALKEITAGQSPVRTAMVIAGVDPQRAQKVNNQLRALKDVSSETEVIVFVDADVIARGDFLKHLIAPLADAQIGVSTGYRFYIASIGNWPSVLRSLWNRMSAWEMAGPDAFAWGGAMAIRHSIFEKARVADHWDRACDDDLSLTTAVKDLGLRVHFVPQCLVASDGDQSVAEIFEWTNRQLILTKVYYPKLWRRAIARATLMAAWLLLMCFAIGGWIFTSNFDFALATIAGACIVPVEVWFLLHARGLWQRVLSDRAGYLQESLAASCMAIPLAHFVLPWLTLYSVVTNRIQWRGITYELRSPTETLVIS
jgi:cellulose synthase/poly-beta-1,6-N-acetylglucosamine synthase-like glycosyltransferase